MGDNCIANKNGHLELFVVDMSISNVLQEAGCHSVRESSFWQEGRCHQPRMQGVWVESDDNVPIYGFSLLEFDLFCFCFLFTIS